MRLSGWFGNRRIGAWFVVGWWRRRWLIGWYVALTSICLFSAHQSKHHSRQFCCVWLNWKVLAWSPSVCWPVQTARWTLQYVEYTCLPTVSTPRTPLGRETWTSQLSRKAQHVCVHVHVRSHGTVRMCTFPWYRTNVYGGCTQHSITFFYVRTK